MNIVTAAPARPALPPIDTSGSTLKPARSNVEVFKAAAEFLQNIPERMDTSYLAKLNALIEETKGCTTGNLTEKRLLDMMLTILELREVNSVFLNLFENVQLAVEQQNVITRALQIVLGEYETISKPKPKTKARG